MIPLSVTVKPRDQLLSDVIRASKTHPKGWHAAFGHDSIRCSHDCYLFHPDMGLFFLKEYQKNPYETLGVGTKLVRRIDDDIIDSIEHNPGTFGILQGDLNAILTHLHNGVAIEEIIEGAITDRDYGLRMPISGHATADPRPFTELNQRYHQEKKKLLASYGRLVADEGRDRSYD